MHELAAPTHEFKSRPWSRPLKTISTLCAALFAFVVASSARASLAPAFAGKVTVDTSFVTGADQPTDIAFAGDGRAIVTQKTGPILVRRSNGTVNVVPYPFGGTLDSSSEKGVLGVVADPNVATSHAFYFYVSNGPTSDKHRVYRAVLTASDTLQADAIPIVAASRNVGPGLEGPANHDGGSLFIYHGQLYLGVGDTGSNATPPVNKYGSCLNKGNGKLLRVNLDGSVPSDNPLFAVGSVTACDSPTGPWTTAAPDRRIFAWGLRNPWRFWIDSQTGLAWVGDVGEVTEEEISIVQPNQHYGYPFVEGGHAWGNVDGMNCSTLTPSRSCTSPVFSYTHAVGQSVTGGLVPEGCGWTKVFGSPNYLFGDYSAGWIHALAVNASRTGVTGSAVDFATSMGTPVSMRMGPDGSMYVVSNATGEVHRYTPIDRTGPDCLTGVPATTAKWNGWLFALLALVGAWTLQRGLRKHAIAAGRHLA